MGHVESAGGRIPVDELGPRGEAGQCRRGDAQHRVLVLAGLGPVHEEEAEIGQRVAERADLPVEDGDDVARVVEDRVVEPVVTVHDGHALLLGDLGRQLLPRPVDDGRAGATVEGGLLELAVPPLELPGDVALTSGEVTEADGVDVDGVQAGQRVDQGVARPGPDPLGHGRRRPLVPEDVALHERHHIERGAVDIRVGAQAERPGDGHVGGLQRADHGVLAGHVVGRGQHVADRRSAQRVGVTSGVGDPVGEVGSAPGDELERVRGHRARHVGRDPGGHGIPVDALHLGPGGGGVRGGVRCCVHTPTLPAPTCRSRLGAGPVVLPGGAARYRRNHGRRHRCHVRGGSAEALLRGARGGGPVGALVRALHDARPPPGTGGGRHRRRRGAGQGECGREPGRVQQLPGPVDPGGVRRAGRRRRRPVHRGTAGRRGTGLRGGPGPGVFRGGPAGRGRGRCRRRGAPAARPAARARPPGRRPGAGGPVDRPGGHRGGGRPAGSGPRDRRDPSSAGGGPSGRSGRCRRCRRRDPARRPLERVKDDPEARQEFLDLLETLGPDDPRTLQYRKSLSSRLF